MVRILLRHRLRWPIDVQDSETPRGIWYVVPETDLGFLQQRLHAVSVVELMSDVYNRPNHSPNSR